MQYTLLNENILLWIYKVPFAEGIQAVFKGPKPLSGKLCLAVQARNPMLVPGLQKAINSAVWESLCGAPELHRDA